MRPSPAGIPALPAARRAKREGGEDVKLTLLAAQLSGCAVVAVADAVVTVGAAAVSVTATVVETTVDVAAAGVDAVVGDDDED